MSEGEKKLKEIGERLKKEVIKEKMEKESEFKFVKNQLVSLQENSELAKMYRESVQIGSENLTGSIPYLKVHATGRSYTNELADGSQPNDGWFFYAPTLEQFKTIECHILTISKGFRVEQVNKDTGEKRMQFNQIMGGLIKRDDDSYSLFIMYLTGLKLSPMWEFGKEAAKYTKMKPIGIPLFALSVTLTTESVKTQHGPRWIVNFQIKRFENGEPEIIMDPGRFQFVKDSVFVVQEQIENLIKLKATEQSVEDQEIPTPIEPY